MLLRAAVLMYFIAFGPEPSLVPRTMGFQSTTKALAKRVNYTMSRVQLLGELLLDRANVKVMMRYVSDAYNLRQMMLLLKDSSRSIQFEAFHVFKVPFRPAPEICRT